MNCGIDLTNPRAAFDACLSIINSTPSWPQLLALGVASAALAGFLAIVLVLLLRRVL
jgi:vacuolar-type H+-ATPase subunit I/STV1